ncbi:AAA family ATPase [Lachnoclostridium sp. Marseille-P6806]|uniref:AAA family ATPase n=1 Tax=Lachnoclostridium sp. Marseille-P6806 TaxID=2364793 RepID=UPI001031FDA9|nr:AAA family ATPase [Lachnoclostridium sp. Marseille-P6806]
MADRVFDFGQAAEDALPAPEEKAEASSCRFFISDAPEATPEQPIMMLADPERRFADSASGVFLEPSVRAAFASGEGQNMRTADILRLDSRFRGLVEWLGKNRIRVRLSGTGTAEGYAVCRIRELASGTETKLSAEDGFLQYVMARLFESSAQEEAAGEESEEDSDDMRLTSVQSLSDYLDCAKNTIPANIRKWARRNLAVARSAEASPEEKRHAQHALSVMLNVRWKDSYFAAIDPVRARAILDEALYGMENVKQRIIETIIQINRTHKLPAYGLLLAGPAGTGKSQIAYAVARILQLPWTSLDMSSIHDSAQLTGSSRVYANARPGSIMEAFSLAGESNLVFIINELDKADSGTAQGSPADALLTLLDNLGFTDNYMECTIPTAGVYPIATANDKSRISEPLMTRFAVIDIPDYTPEEKKTIFLRYALPKVLRRIGLGEEEIAVTDEAAEIVIKRFASQPGVRDLEQAAEHMAANALFRIEYEHVERVVFDAETTEKLMR